MDLRLWGGEGAFFSDVDAIMTDGEGAVIVDADGNVIVES